MSCITQDPSTQVIAFCRSPQWILPPVRLSSSIYLPHSFLILSWNRKIDPNRVLTPAPLVQSEHTICPSDWTIARVYDRQYSAPFIEYRTSSDSWIPQNEFLYLMIFKSSMMRAITTKVDWCYIRKCCRNWSLQIATSYIKSTAPKQYQEKLIPNYRKFPGHQLDVKVNTFGSLAIGCKRVIFDTDFCNALHRPNFDLSWDNAKQIVENGIITTKG